MIKYYIYALCEPETEVIRYIGQTRQTLKQRYKNHISSSKTEKLYKAYWIKKLLSNGEKPTLMVLDILYVDNISKENQLFIDKWEYFYIQKYKKLTRLTNDREIEGFRKTKRETRGNSRKTMLKISKEKGWCKSIKLRHIETGEIFEFASVREAWKTLGMREEQLRLLRKGWNMVKQSGKLYKKIIKQCKGYEIVID